MPGLWPPAGDIEDGLDNFGDVCALTVPVDPPRRRGYQAHEHGPVKVARPVVMKRLAAGHEACHRAASCLLDHRCLGAGTYLRVPYLFGELGVEVLEFGTAQDREQGAQPVEFFVIGVPVEV